MGIGLLVLVLFRGTIFRNTINYNKIGTRTTISISNQILIDKIESRSANRNLNIKQIIQIAKSVTIEELSFSGNQVSNDPNVIIQTKKANCIGYAALFNSIADYLIVKNNLSDQIEVKHLIGQLDFFGLDLHQFFDSPFFKDHDFNSIQHLVTKEVYYVDPSISDYLGIDKVVSKRRKETNTLFQIFNIKTIWKHNA